MSSADCFPSSVPQASMQEAGLCDVGTVFPCVPQSQSAWLTLAYPHHQLNRFSPCQNTLSLLPQVAGRGKTDCIVWQHLLKHACLLLSSFCYMDTFSKAYLMLLGLCYDETLFEANPAAAELQLKLGGTHLLLLRLCHDFGGGLIEEALIGQPTREAP